LGKVRAGYDRVENVVRIADDLVAVVSSGRRDGRQSIQIFDVPELNPGPWLLTGDLKGDDAPPPKPASAGGATEPSATLPKPLVPFEWDGAEVGDDGRLLFLERPGDNGQSDWIAVAMPPWGERLRQLMLAP